jgi:DNA ligase-1
MRLHDIAEVSAAVAATPARLAKIDHVASCLRRLAPSEVSIAVAYLSGRLPQGTIGVGWASLRDLPPAAPAPPTLELVDVDAALERIARMTGPGSQQARRRGLHDVFGRATDRERSFLIGLLIGDVRQGALEGVMVEAVARAAELPAADVRRAVMVAGDIGSVATSVLVEGRLGLERFRLKVLRPLKPMLAQSAEDLDAALAKIHPAAIEWKVDGARVQIHRLGDEVRVFTRNLAEVGDRVPEVVAVVRGLAVSAAIFDAEVIALRDDGRPQPFQATMSRFGSKLDAEHLSQTRPLTPFVFDCLHLDGDDLIDRAGSERFARLIERLPQSQLIPRTVTNNNAEAERLLHDALARGHEGVMVKALGAPYEAGRRGGAWLKVKRAHTLDLVVLGAEWGHGRRRGWLSNLHLGARDPNGGFVMLGKTFKGMTDEMLAWQTERLLELETGRDGITVFVRPELVVEVAFDGIQSSSRYPGGVALRFARVKGYRTDKHPEEADTIDVVRALAAY